MRVRTDIDQLDDWTGPECLTWLAAMTDPPHHYGVRALDWENEVLRFSAYEGRDPGEWEDAALEELRREITARVEDHDASETARRLNV